MEEEEKGDFRGASVDEFMTRLSSNDDLEGGKDGVNVSLDCDTGGDEEEEEEEGGEFDSDSGMGSDDFDLLEVGGESGTEFCLIGDQACSVPLELYDLSNLSEVLSLDVWNDCLSRDEKLSLCKYLPDMDQATFMTTLKDLLSGSNMYFGNPVIKFFNMLKGGLCEPSVSLHRQGLTFFLKQQYYHFLRSYQNNIVSDYLQIKDVWSCCTGQSFEDKLKFLNDMRKQRRLTRETVCSKGCEGDSYGNDEILRAPLSKDRNVGRLKGHHNDALMSSKVFPKLVGMHDSRLSPSRKDHKQDLSDTSGIIYYATERRIRNLLDCRGTKEIGVPKLKKKKKHEEMNANGFNHDAFIYPEVFLKKNVSGINFMRSELHRKGKYHDRNVGRKKDKSGRGSPVFIANTNGTSYSPMSDPARNDDTESDSSDLHGEEAYGYHLKNKLDYVQPIIKKRKTALFETTTSSKKSVRLHDQFRKVEKASDIKDDSYQCFSHDGTVSSSEFATQNSLLRNTCSAVEFPDVEKDELLERDVLVEDVVRGRLQRIKKKKIYVDDIPENSNTPMRRCSSVKKKNKKGKGGRKLGKFNIAQSVSLLPVSEATDCTAMEAEMMNVEPDPTPQRKTYTLITPTMDCSFPFSVIHLLSAVRVALITPYLEGTLEMQNEIQEAQSRIPGDVSQRIHPNDSIEGSNSGGLGQGGVPSFSVQEIVNRVKLNPGDPCILETQEPLLDLVRGVLKLFSSKSAPQGAKCWKPIAKYERSSKSWSWIGPVNRALPDTETVEEATSHESWGIPHRMLVKLVDAFAIWLKNSQEILRELGSLPPPPSSLLQFNIDAKDRLKDLRVQKSLSTISPSTEEVRDYFRREEYLRYSIPDRAFTYTAADGKKSAVAPLRRGGGNPSAKVRDHYMLKSDRPPHVTILCLVRDAAARLPGSIGTRADVCTLIRDSQYISENVTDNQVTHILSGALDRLHYEQDPCVKFEQERKLWVYLHRDRYEEDFDEDGTLSTKKWKKPKKEAATAQATDVVAVDEQQQTDGQQQMADEQQPGYTEAATLQLDLLACQPVDHESVRDYSEEFNGAF